MAQETTQQKQINKALMLLGLKDYPMTEEELKDRAESQAFDQWFAWFVLIVTIVAAVVGATFGVAQ